MKLFQIAAMGLAITTLPTSAMGQSQPLVIGQSAAEHILPEGTAVPLRTLAELNSRRARVGDRFNLEVAEDVTLNGRVVIPAGSPAVGEVTKRTGKGMFGKSGKLEVRLLHVRVGDQQIRIGGSGEDRGKGGTAGTVASLVFAWPAAFFVTGTSAVIAPGTQMNGYLEADLPVVFSGEPVGPAPLVVSARPTVVAPLSTASAPGGQAEPASLPEPTKTETCAEQAARQAPFNPQTAKSLEKKCEARKR